MSNDKPSFHEAGLEVLATGLNLAELDLRGGDGLWDEVRRYTRESHFEALADRCLDGRSAPRLWAVMEAPAAGPAAVATGLGLATVLADRGQAVVLLDGDEQEPRLTRWIGRTEQEGWIDMVRFGASLHASSEPLPSDNRRGSVVGVGSFAPTGVTAEEVADLLGRLRHQADDVVMVLPAKLRSQPWVAAANIRLLCWDLLGRSGSDTRTIVAELDRMDGRPTYLVGFGVEEFAAIQDRLSEVPGEDEAAAPVVVSTPDEPAIVVDDIAPEAPTPAPEPVPSHAEPASDDLDAAPDVPPTSPRRRSSGIFIFTAIAAVACLALVGWFLAGQLRGTDEPSTPAVAVVAEPVRQEPVVEAPVVQEPVAQEPGDVVEDMLEEPAAEAAEPDVTEVEAEAPAAVDAVPTEPPAAIESEVEAPATPAFEAAPFRQPVGEAGWALWLYSLPDEAAAAREVRELERRGLVAVTRAVEIKDRGRWHRVYTGSFASRAEATAAAEGLKATLRHDWAVPSRF
jgi:hypothetical protein